MVTQIEPLTFQYSHTIGRQETRGGNGFFYPVAIARGEGNRLSGRQPCEQQDERAGEQDQT